MSLTQRNEISILSSVITTDLDKLARSHSRLDPKETTVIILTMNCVDAELDLN
jgi:hypothetical protein